MKKFLEWLPDVNRLKPAVWAIHNSDPELFGVSVGVRHHVRPTFLCTKLIKLKKNYSTRSCLSQTKAFSFKNITTGSFETNVSTPYNQEKGPCPSCRVSFDKLENFNSSKIASFGPFGNCAEYDVIHTPNLNFILQNSSVEWVKFKSACEDVFEAFKTLILSTISQSNVEQYLKKMREDAKFLQYKKNAGNFLLKAEDWWEFKKSNGRHC